MLGHGALGQFALGEVPPAGGAIVSATALLQGAANLSASAVIAGRATATLAGAGAISGNASVVYRASATLVGAGAIFSFPAGITFPAPMRGIGGISVNANIIARVAASLLRGDSQLVASASIIEGPGHTSAFMQGTGRLTANATVRSGPPRPREPGKYVPPNVPLRRTIVRKHR